jgi:CubicO group peptidase (beta-lactamase class C family)
MTIGGFSRARLGKMHTVMAGYVERGELPGIVTLLARKEEVHVDAIGSLGIGGSPIRRDTIFRISSMTKPIVAAATMILVEECKVRLDEPVDRFLPELADRKVLKRLEGPLDETVPASRGITVRDLLTFRMGFGVVMAPPGAYPIQKATDDLLLGQGPPSPSVPPDPDEWIRRLGTLPLMHQPGERWMYNTSADVLGVLIARVSGQTLVTFLAERIFDPLNMRDTGFNVPITKVDRLTTSYRGDQAGALVVYDEADGGQWSRKPAFPSGGGGLVSTADDYHAFARMLLNRGKLGRERVLARPSVDLMTADHLTPVQKSMSGLTSGYFDGHGWGFGMAVVTKSEDLGPSVGSFGWDGGMGTSCWSDPKEDLVGILLTQRMWTSPVPPAVHRDFWTSAYHSIDD